MSIENGVENIVGDIIVTAAAYDIEPSELLARVVSRMLLSDDDDICHVNGLEFMQKCDKVLTQKKSE